MLPETVVADRGRVFTSKNLKDVCGQLGINLEPNPTKRPWFKGEIERFFKTNNTGVIHSVREEPLTPEEGDEDSAK